MKVTFLTSIDEIDENTWNYVVSDRSLFLRHQFLSGLEQHSCVGEKLGWLPFHQVVRDSESSQLLAVLPLYLKYNSYGELVFDWSWADAYTRVGRAYYPKFVSAIPYTPVTGPRLCVADGVDAMSVKSLMIDALTEKAKELDLSSIHCLFPMEDDIDQFEVKQYVTRLACQFHWQNRDYESFSHFLSFFSSRKRKNILKERKRVTEQGITFQVLLAKDIEEDLWELIYLLYRKTFDEKGGYATFTLEFFKHISQKMGDQLLVTLAVYKGQYVAGTICYRDDTHLYGRHWGCFEEFDSLHFETCYYQGLEYAIEQRLDYFDPGAQGEHKLSRGFLPTKTWSCHWIKDEDFAGAITQFVDQERQYMEQYIQEMRQHTPYKTLV